MQHCPRPFLLLRTQSLRRRGAAYCSDVALRQLNRVLIANRGEIATRVIASARRMGIETVAVFSDADRDSLHVRQADSAFYLGPPPALQSYLNMDRIISVALQSQSQAIHPGYGFLSENAQFAEKCADAGLIFIGPPPRAIRDMGMKSAAKEIMTKAGVPVVPGYHGSQQDDERLRAEAQNIGFPIMLKAVYGGGGKGMRISHSDSDFLSQLQSARLEARKSFGNDEMLIEKFVARPRHVEVQVFADQRGNCVYLFERDCSIQRRHQKIIEEAPAPGVSADVRRRLGEAAVKAARAVGYVGAGTVEFIFDDAAQFFFMEMNTRLQVPPRAPSPCLQVEHPVTEAITGTDLVEWQLRVARGERLPLLQDDLKLHGHAMETRIYAEDTRAGFVPIAGPLTYLDFPRNARVDTGVGQGDRVSVHYDPMIAKVIVWGEDRTAAIRALDAALHNTHIVGVTTNVDFVRSVLAHDEFGKGNVYTDFIADHEKQLFAETKPDKHAMIEIAIATAFIDLHADTRDPFAMRDFFRVNSVYRKRIENENGKAMLEILEANNNRLSMRIDETPVLVDDIEFEQFKGGVELRFQVEVDGRRWKVKTVAVDEQVVLWGTRRSEWTRRLPNAVGQSARADGDVALEARAPMPGVVEKVLVKVGEAVASGQALVVLVAMKMEYVIRAPREAMIAEVPCVAGKNVQKNATLIRFSE